MRPDERPLYEAPAPHPPPTSGPKQVQAPDGASSSDRSRVFVLLVAVPALLVVVLGYVVGHGLWAWLAGLADAGLGTSLAEGAEVAGWITGLLALALAVRWAFAWRRLARTRRD